MLRPYLQGLSNLLFPETCYACEKYEPERKHLLCSVCLGNLPWIDNQGAAEAALTGKDHFPERILTFDSLLYFTKNSRTQHLISEIKYNGQKNLAQYLGERLGQKMKEAKEDWSDFELIPVPIHRKRLRERGFNQAHEIALGIQKILKVEINNEALIRTKHETSQTKKDKKERSEVLLSSFASHPRAKKQPTKMALLIDDVITTGATVFTCSEVLRQLKYPKIAIVTLAISI